MRHLSVGVVPFALALIGCWDEQTLVEVREASLEIASARAIDIAVGAGSLDVVGEPGLDRVIVRAELRRSSPSPWNDDDEAIEALEMTLAQDGETVRLAVPTDALPSEYFIDVFVRMPAEWPAAIVDQSGDATITDVAALRVRDESGTLSIARIAGAVEITDGSGDLQIDGVGALQLEDDSGDVEVRDVGGDAQITDASGELAIADVVGSAEIRDGSGGIVLQRIGGTATITDGSGDILAERVGDLIVLEDESGEVSRD